MLGAYLLMGHFYDSKGSGGAPSDFEEILKYHHVESLPSKEERLRVRGGIRGLGAMAPLTALFSIEDNSIHDKCN